MSTNITAEAQVDRAEFSFVVRLAIGLAQGLLLYLLYRAGATRGWPATDGLAFAPMVLVALFVPVIASLGLRSVRPKVLLVWVAVATAVLAGLALHDIHRATETMGWSPFNPGDWPEPRVAPSAVLLFASAAGLFMAHTLVVGSALDRRVIARYSTHFDVAWKHAVQALLAAVFVGVFWGLLALGAALFNIIEVRIFEAVIRKPWFSIPATTLAVAAAIHATDVGSALVRGIRTVGLALLAWLLPLMTLIAVGFLASLPFTGLEPQWRTRHATALILSVCTALVVLINAAYQDGPAERGTAPPLRVAGSLAALALTPLVILAGYALALRVQQYGWTTDRITAAACVSVAACYALGYAWAVLSGGQWLRRIEHCNLATGFVMLALLLALMTPLADPARLSVASQVARLESGKVAPREFDFAYLRFEGGRYGRAALERLKSAEGERAVEIRAWVNATLQQKSKWHRETLPPTPDELAQNITVFPQGRALPAEFLTQDWSLVGRMGPRALGCLSDRITRCDAIMINLDDDGTEEIVLFQVSGSGEAAVFKQFADRTWRQIGTLGPHHLVCRDHIEALREGHFSVVTPSATWNDVIIEGRRLRVQTVDDEAARACR